MEPLEPRLRLYEGAFEAIRDYVVRERLRPGDPLPSERQIQQQLGISRAPVREALRVLQSVGIIEARQGKGLFVKEMNLRPMVDAFVSHLELIDTDSFEHLLGLRQILELGAADLAAKQRTDDDLARMDAILAAMRQRIDRRELVLEEDLGFHELLVQATHNPLLEHLYACLTPFLVAVREGGELTAQALDECLTDHTAIYEAVRDREAGLAIRLMQEHMESVRRQLADDRQS
ncbi:MAG TPA: FadR/GntR family transcriptional regulator [Thermomicrobiales bacterium]|nr:FadR/GntR family transcriptional regulator [Thermomicrobiales bacterium]